MLDFYQKMFYNREYADVAKLADALALGASGRPWGFDSLHPHQERPNGLFLLTIFIKVLWESNGCEIKKVASGKFFAHRHESEFYFFYLKSNAKHKLVFNLILIL